MTEAKANRQKFGLAGAPIQATKVYRKAMEFDHKHVTTNSWIAIRPDGRRTHLNSYDGKLGRNVNPDEFTYDMPDEKKMRKVLKGYVEVPAEEWPEFISPVATEGTPETSEDSEKTE